MRRRDDGAHKPFERSPERWQAMGAPAFMWDDAAAVEVERAVSRCGYRLDGFDSPQCDRLLAKRLRRVMAAAVLDACDALTGVERDRIAISPGMHPLTDAPGSWRSDVTIADVLAGRIPVPHPPGRGGFCELPGCERRPVRR